MRSKTVFQGNIVTIHKPATAIGFVMPNGPVPGGMQATAMSVDDVEHITGHDFFSSLPQQTEQTVESQCQFHKWASIK